MNPFERRLSKPNPEAAKQELEYGHFSMLPEERDAIIKKALAEGRDPQAALQEHAELLAQANGRLREKESKEMIKKLERHMNRQFPGQKPENK